MGSSQLDAERRHLTVMFCELVDSTSIVERLDPEEYTNLISSYQQTCNRAIAKYEGFPLDIPMPYDMRNSPLAAAE